MSTQGQKQPREKEQLDQLKIDFVSNALHELRTPLTIIKSHLDLALHPKSKGVVDPYQTLNTINDEIDRIARLIRDLGILAHDNPKDLKNLLSYEEVSLDKLITSVMKGLAPIAQEREIVIEKDIPNDVTIWGDREQLTRLVTNLLVNAIDHGKRGGTVNIALSRTAEDATLAVHDDGSGIPENELPYLFERFHKGDTSHGTGLGLAISKWITEAHGGSISVTSTPESGSTFTARLLLGKQSAPST